MVNVGDLAGYEAPTSTKHYLPGWVTFSLSRWVILWLTKTKYVYGQVVTVDGGWLAKNG